MINSPSEFRIETNALYFRARDERAAQAIAWRGFADVLGADSTITLHANPLEADGAVIKVMLKVSLSDLTCLNDMYQMTASAVDRITRDCFVDADAEPGLEEDVYEEPGRRWQLE